MIDKIVVGNVPVHLFTINSLHDTVCESVYLKKKRLFLHANARLVELANTNEIWLQDFCNNQVDYVMCDGAGIQLAARLTNQTVPKKIAYNIWIWIFAKFLKEQGFSLFLLGADNDTINNAKIQLENHVEGIKIVGAHHGFFDKKKGSEETVNVLNHINSAKPDILLVGFGMPVQELWISENYPNISAYCIFTCGGAFDFISGNKQVAPKLFIRFHLEWLFRFLLEPVRLFERVTLSFFRFGRLLAKQLLRRPKGEKR
jgi:N-acetylglucosaminyldiphosphoundecaprenol N-acetyl-beta-D-mannosaminyltransferase